MSKKNGWIYKLSIVGTVILPTTILVACSSEPEGKPVDTSQFQWPEAIVFTGDNTVGTFATKIDIPDGSVIHYQVNAGEPVITIPDALQNGDKLVLSLAPEKGYALVPSVSPKSYDVSGLIDVPLDMKDYTVPDSLTYTGTNGDGQVVEDTPEFKRPLNTTFLYKVNNSDWAIDNNKHLWNNYQLQIKIVPNLGFHFEGTEDKYEILFGHTYPVDGLPPKS